MEFTASFALVFIFLVIGGGITPIVGNQGKGDSRVSCDDDDNCEIEITFSDADDLQRQLEEIMPCTPDQPETSSIPTVTQPTNSNVKSTELITTGVTVPPTSTTVTNCSLPDCAISPNGYQYKVLPDEFTWEKAIEACKEENATLPRQAYEPDVNEILITLLEKQEWSLTEFWLPLSDQEKEGEWRWHGDESLLNVTQFWGNRQPDNHGGDQNCACVSKRHGYKWDDAICRWKRNVVCERKI